MNQTKHTPEPWVYGGMVKAEAAQAYEAFSPWIENAGPRTTPVGKSVCIVDADMKRLVACVNACTGMTDPEKEVAELRKQRDELLAACASVHSVLETPTRTNRAMLNLPVLRDILRAAIKNAGGGQ